MTKNEAKNKIQVLIDRFSSQKDYYKSTNYNETQTRQDFINPFFTALGWDLDNSKDQLETYRDVRHEDKIKVNGHTKVPDYSFNINGKRKFFVEAKKPSVSIRENPLPALQVRSYAWNGGLSISILTDFEELAIYDCTRKPKIVENANAKRLKYIYYTDYIKEFDFIWDTFSFECVTNGSIERYAKNKINFKNAEPVDKEFLKTLEKWREDLAVSIASNNKQLEEEEINFAVQQTIDRIVFLKVCEDRKIENENNLLKTIKSGNYYQNLYAYFQTADQKYNSGLFDFKKDTITKNVVIENKIFKKIITELYGKSTEADADFGFNFAIIPVEILGFAYEQFLGKVIKLNLAHHAEIVEKPEVRKAGGVFYTPEYIVEYIVKQTVGELIENKTPDQISSIKILDPSCGSGSFLLGAYQYLLDYHLKYYHNHKSARFQKSDRFENPLTPEGNLSSQEKKRILLNNIFGVDIDTQAVEVTKLSLLLKALEGETDASIQTSLQLFNERVLPTIDSNIQCGNSLIAPDFYNEGLFLTPKEERKINVFDWQTAFPEIFKQGGFDCVIGNPPYGAELKKIEQTYLDTKYKIGSTDTAALFLMQAKILLKNNGLNMYIIPKSFTYASNWAKVRKNLLSDINEIVDCGKVWKDVKLEMSICKSQKNMLTDKFTSSIRNNSEILKIGNIEKTLCEYFDFILNGLSEEEIKIGIKIRNQKKVLNDFVNNQRGDMFQKHITDEGDYSVLGGKQIQRYFISKSEKGKINNDFVTDNKAFIKDNSILVQNIVAHVMKPKPHLLIIATIPEQLNKNAYVIVDTVNQLQNISEYNIKFVLGLINSKLISWYVYRFIFANAIRTMHFDSTTTSKIPFPDLDLTVKKQKQQHDELVKLVNTIIELNKRLQNTKLQSEKDTLKRRIEYTDNEINKSVYQLYGITEQSEIYLIEGKNE